MKTSNKLLLTFFLALICSSFVSLLVARKNMTVIKHETVVGNNKVVKQVIQEKLNGHTIELEDWHEYLVDANSEGIAIEAEENIIPEYAITETEDGTEIDLKPGKRSWNATPQLIFGIAGQDSLVIKIEDAAKLKQLGKLNLQYLKIEAQDQVDFELDIQVDVLELVLSDNASLSLSGSANQINVMLDDQSKLDATELTCEGVEISMYDNTSFKLASAKKLNGSIKDQARFEVIDDKVIESQAVRTWDHAEMILGDR